MGSPSVTIVVPVYNEEASLETLAGEIRQAADGNELDVEIVFVDDGSTDASWARIVTLAEDDSAIAGIRFRRNAGKAAALTAGFAAARGEIVFMADADLQDPPEEMPRLIAKLDEGYDLVSGWKQVRHDPWHKVYPSRVFNRMIGWLTGVRLHDHVCGLKCFRRQVVKDLRIYGGFHRFIGVLAAAKGYRVTELPTLHRPRTHGVGKYGFTRFFKGFLDLLTVWFLTRYRWRPQHVIGVTGLIVILVNVLGAVLLRTLQWGVLGWLIWLVAAVVPGLILIAVGLVAESVTAQRPLDDLYAITERVGWCARPDPQTE